MKSTIEIAIAWLTGKAPKDLSGAEKLFFDEFLIAMRIITKCMSIIEVLDSERINSNLESWISECKKFREWYTKLGVQKIDEVAMAKAYLKIEPKTVNKLKSI